MSFQALNIAVKVLKHGSTGLMAAYSDDLPGLLVHGHTRGEVEAKLPAAVKELLDARNMGNDYIVRMR